MPTLEWIGKDKVMNHHQQVPYRVLEEKYTYNAEQSDNMIIRGDNLEALKALLPKYKDYSSCRGKLISKSEYDNNGILKKKTSYTYTSGSPVASFMRLEKSVYISTSP